TAVGPRSAGTSWTECQMGSRVTTRSCPSGRDALSRGGSGCSGVCSTRRRGSPVHTVAPGRGPHRAGGRRSEGARARLRRGPRMMQSCDEGPAILHIGRYASSATLNDKAAPGRDPCALPHTAAGAVTTAAENGSVSMTNVTDTAAPGGPSRPTGRHGRRRVALLLVAIIAVIAVVLTGGALAYAKQFEGRALPGTTVLGQDVAGKTPEEIAALVAERGDSVTVTVTAGDKELEKSLADLGVTVDATATAQAAMDRDDSFADVIASTWSGEHAVDPVVTVDEAATKAFAESLVPEGHDTPVDASVSFDEDSQTWTAEPGRNGQGLDPEPLVAAVSETAPALEDFAVEQPVEELAPAITTEEAEEVVGSIATLLEQPMSITGADGETHEVSAERRNDWISVAPAEDGQSL